jgi:parallel beta-helix repeat protein
MLSLWSSWRVGGALLAASSIFGLTPIAPCDAATWRVPSEHPTICGCVDSAAYGDTVLVEPGTYLRERAIEVDGGIVWIVMKDGITLTSEGGAEVTELVEPCPGVLNTIIKCDSVSDATIQGFTIRFEGSPPQGYSRGIAMGACKMTVESNVIEGATYGIVAFWEPPRPDRPIIVGNEICYCEVGINLKDVWSCDSPRILDNHIHHCWADGIYSRDSDPYIEGNTIEYNGWNGIYFVGYSKSLMLRNTIRHNTWDGVGAWMTYVMASPSLNQTGYKENANDIYGNGGYAVWYHEETGFGLFGASKNYWGTLCPESAKFYGRVDWIPWVDGTHTTVCYDCESCQPATSPTTWGSIKAMFK